MKWLIILATAAASTCILIIGFAYSLFITNSSVYGSNIKNNSENKTEEVINQLDANSYNVLVMGDSLAKEREMKIMKDLQAVLLSSGNLKLQSP